MTISPRLRWELFVAAFGILLLGLLATSPSSASQEPAPAPQAGADPGPEASASDQERDRNPRARARVRNRRLPFWHQEAVAEAIGLTEAQVHELDQLHRVFHKQRLEISRQKRQDGVDIAVALSTGDWQSARILTQGEARAAGEIAKLETELKIQAMKGLTAKQRETLGNQYRHLLQLPWLISPPNAQYPAGRGGPLLRNPDDGQGDGDGNGGA